MVLAGGAGMEPDADCTEAGASGGRPLEFTAGSGPAGARESDPTPISKASMRMDRKTSPSIAVSKVPTKNNLIQMNFITSGEVEPCNAGIRRFRSVRPHEVIERNRFAVS